MQTPDPLPNDGGAKAEGPLQNIIVRPGDKKGRFYVSAGGRRFAAYTHLAESGDWPKDHPIECKVRAADEATEISLTENVQREAIHRADEFEAFLMLTEAGKTPKEIAERFGTSELIVNRRLALAKVSPVIFDLYRKDEVSFEQLHAFTITDDHARQVEVWENLPCYNRAALHQTDAHHRGSRGHGHPRPAQTERVSLVPQRNRLATAFVRGGPLGGKRIMAAFSTEATR